MRQALSVSTFILLVSLPSLGLESPGGQELIWQIGKFDLSTAEMSVKTDFVNPEFNPVFKVGQNDPANDWPALQPGSENLSAGRRPHPYTILFALKSPLKGNFILTLSFLRYSSRTPDLQIEINGKKGKYYLSWLLSYNAGDMGAAFSAIYSRSQLEIRLPAALLRSGENSLTLTAVDSQKDGPGDSILAYDALRMTRDSVSNPPLTPDVTVEPTIFFTEVEGGLFELTNVTVTATEKVRQGKVVLRIDRQRLEANLSSDGDFGQQRFQFRLPQFTPNTPVDVLLSVNGRSRHWSLSLEPKRKWTIYLVPHEHLDVGYTDYQAKVAEVQNRNIDKLVDEIGQHPEMRFSIDGSWIARNYLATRKAAAGDAFMALVQANKIGVPASYMSLMTGYATLEELIRSTDYTHDLHRVHGIPFEYDSITDMPSYTWSYASILSSLGLKYFAAASNNDRAPVLLYGRWNEQSPFWWQGPDGNKVLMAYTRSYGQLSLCGLPPKEATCRQALPTFLEQYDSPSNKPDVVLMYGAQGENTDMVPGEPAFVESWNSHFSYPKFVFATFADYFHYIDQHFSSQIETVVGDFGPYWEAGMGTDTWYGAIDRSSQQRAPSAEKLSTIATYLQPKVAGPAEDIRRMWEDLVLYAEHSFGSWGEGSRPESEESVRQLATKHQFVLDGRERVNAIVDESLSQLTDRIRIPANSIVVFNSLSWKRSELVETDIDVGKVITEYPGNEPIPFEILRHGTAGNPHDPLLAQLLPPDYVHVRFLAQDVPSLGFKCYQIAKATGQTPSPTGEASLAITNTLENTYYRLDFDPAAGAIKSLVDKQFNKELVDSSSPYRLNQYLYVSGGGEAATQLVFLRKALPLAKLLVNRAGPGRLTSIRKTGFGQILTYQTSAPHTPSIETEVILFDNEKKIEFINRLHKDPVGDKEGVYFAFPLAINAPSFSYEIQNGWVDPARDSLKGACREWFTVQHWVKVSGSDYAIGMVPVDAPLVTFGDIDRGTWPERFEPKNSTVYSWLMNNYWHTGAPGVQSGDYTFRYVLTSGPSLSPEALARFGRAAMTPLEVDQVIDNDKVGNPDEPLPATPVSFLKLDNNHVVVENWKMAADGMGTVIRLIEVGGRQDTVRLEFPQITLKQAWLTNAVEEPLEEATVAQHYVDIKMRPHEIVTLKIVASGFQAPGVQ